ncbi:MAG TPA: glycine zipper domain-containing protein [Opitutaceae bacterium]|nr:glycine zipper domain-containing protein [Opitutaceae bacterium]
MRTKSAFILAGVVALSLCSAAMAGDRDRRHDSSRDHDRRGHHVSRHDGPRGRDIHVWSHHRPRPHFRAHHMPPPLRHQWMPHRPSYRHIWVSGYWQWRSPFAEWVWVDGYWALPPRSGVVYVAPRYVEVGGGVEYVEGGWCESSYASANDGTATGVVLGGVAGGIIGHQSKNTAAGALIGAVVGGIIGHSADAHNAEVRAEKREAARIQAETEAERRTQEQIALGQQTSDAELAAAQERARVAKEKLAAAKAEREAARGRAAALEKAEREAAAAEAELSALETK